MNKTKNHRWLLLRGLTRESGHWGDFIPQLQTAFPHTQINTLDLPGTGIYYQQTSPRSIPEITRQLRQQAFENGWLEAKIMLLAPSLGGMVAWEWLQQYPNDIHGAVLMNISLRSLNPFYQRLRWQNYLTLAQIILQSDYYSRELAVVKLVSNRESSHETVARAWAKIQRAHPVSRKNALSQIMAAAHYRPKLEKPLPPLLLLNGLKDKLVSPDCSNNISQRWSVSLMSHSWAGHDLCIDDAAWVIAQLADFQTKIISI